MSWREILAGTDSDPQPHPQKSHKEQKSDAPGDFADIAIIADAPGSLKIRDEPDDDLVGEPLPTPVKPARLRDRRESDRSPANSRKSPTHYFIELVARAWCPVGDFERRLQRIVPGRPLVALEAKLGQVLRCVEVGVLTHRQARAAAESLSNGAHIHRYTGPPTPSSS